MKQWRASSGSSQAVSRSVPFLVSGLICRRRRQPLCNATKKAEQKPFHFFQSRDQMHGSGLHNSGESSQRLVGADIEYEQLA